MKMQTAQFISFEGTEGVGKTTAINGICQRLTEMGIEYIRTREPGGSDFAERMRAILLDPATNINDDTELLLMFTARVDHLAKVILPALQSGKWVICDRFVDSTLAYQGYGRCAGNPQMMNKIQQLSNDFISKMPDKTIWLDLPVAEGMARAGKRSLADRFEQEQIDFFQRIYQGYEYLAKHEPNRFRRVNAKGTEKEVLERVWAVFKDGMAL